MRVKVELDDSGQKNDSKDLEPTEAPKPTQAAVKDDSEKSEKSENKEEKNNDVNQNEIRENIKKAIDDYEAFIDEYCEFMKNYDSSDMSQLSEYASLVAKELEMSQSFKAIEDEELTDAEAAYYAEVSLRCSKKLAEAAV